MRKSSWSNFYCVYLFNISSDRFDFHESNPATSFTDIQRVKNNTYNGSQYSDDNSKKACFRRNTKLFWESAGFARKSRTFCENVSQKNLVDVPNVQDDFHFHIVLLKEHFLELSPPAKMKPWPRGSLELRAISTFTPWRVMIQWFC